MLITSPEDTPTSTGPEHATSAGPIDTPTSASPEDTPIFTVPEDHKDTTIGPGDHGDTPASIGPEDTPTTTNTMSRDRFRVSSQFIIIGTLTMATIVLVAIVTILTTAWCWKARATRNCVKELSDEVAVPSSPLYHQVLSPYKEWTKTDSNSFAMTRKHEEPQEADDTNYSYIYDRIPSYNQAYMAVETELNSAYAIHEQHAYTMSPNPAYNHSV
jgi:hypothetical protein